MSSIEQKLKAADALRDVVIKAQMPHEVWHPVMDAVNAYDAADRAGKETKDEGMEAGAPDDAVGRDTATDCADCGSEIAPSPTDAAADDKTRITDLVTRADAATSRLDMHMQRLDDLQLWREGVEKNTVRQNHLNSIADEQIGGIEDRLLTLEAACTPVPVVTDEMLDAYQTEMNHQRGETMREHARRSIAAALAAGGAR